MSMEDFGAFDEPNNNNLNFDAGDDDAFAAASDPFAVAGGMQMNSQTAAPMMAGPKHDDYTPEELEIIQRVDLEQQDRKKQLYEKMQQEESAKNERKIAGQQALNEWRMQRDTEV